MSTQPKHTIAPIAHSDAWRVDRDGKTLITTHATEGARQIATEIAVALDGTSIPAPLRRHLDAERRELLSECGAMARTLENLARSLRKVSEGTELHAVTWNMETLATHGATAKALARSAADLARLETLTSALDNATSNALAAAEAVPLFVVLANTTTQDGASWRLIRTPDGWGQVETITARSLERGLSWAYVRTVELAPDVAPLAALDLLMSVVVEYHPTRPAGAEPSGKIGEVV